MEKSFVRHTSLKPLTLRVAWAAVKNKYQKGDDGKWHPVK
jgi:cation transport regulator ChaB